MTLYVVPSQLAWQIAEGDVLVVHFMHLPDGDPIVIDGVAALIWTSAREGEDPVSAVSEATGKPVDRISEEVSGYLSYLIDAGLLEEVGP